MAYLCIVWREYPMIFMLKHYGVCRVQEYLSEVDVGNYVELKG